MPLNHTIYGFPGIPWVGYLGVGYLGGTDGTLGPMGPWDRWDLGLKDPRYFLRGYFLQGYFLQGYFIDTQPSPGPVPDPRLPGPGAGYPATRARCRISGCRAGNSYPGPDPRLPGPGAGYPATGPAKKIQKNRKKFFHHFFTLISPKPALKPSDGSKNHPRTIKKSYFLMIFFKKFEILIKSSI